MVYKERGSSGNLSVAIEKGCGSQVATMSIPPGLSLRLAQEQEDSIEEEIAASERLVRRRRRRRVWVRPWLLRRPVF